MATVSNITLAALRREIKSHYKPERALFLSGFFKTGKGQYAEGDIFYGLTVPLSRSIAKAYRGLTITYIVTLLHSKIHEERLIALFMLIDEYERGNEALKTKIHKLFLANTKYVNNWDLVDTSAESLVGDYLLNRPRAILYTLAKSKLLWDRRIAIVATMSFIDKQQFDDTIAISELLLHDKHDLIHKASGWMLREMGKQDITPLTHFLDRYAAVMPRTMLRYSLEKLSDTTKRKYMSAAKRV